MFKRLFSIIFIFLAFGYVAYSFYAFSLSPCDTTLQYSIGQFDTEFAINKEEFKAQIGEAEKIWEKALNRDIFVYNPDSSFKINLIYDERQRVVMQKQKVEFGLQAAEDVLNKLDLQFSNMKMEYDALVSAHKKSVSSLESRQRGYESKVSYWNARGGAPKEEYTALQKEGVALNKESANLNTQVAVINAKSKELNALLEERNKAATSYNKVVRSYNQKYGHGLEFDQAEYVSGERNPLILNSANRGEINVYEFTNKTDLTLALAHELGHAIGMGHVENSQSIMYYSSGADTYRPTSPSEEDLAELNRVCQ